MYLTENPDSYESLHKLGLEPFSKEMIPSYLKEKLSTKNIPIKEALLDQTIISGLGNIYANEEEKKTAEQKAYDKAKDIIEKLKKGEDFSKLAKEYSKDSTTASKGGSLGKINKGDYADEVFEALKNLKDGSYSTSPVKSSYGYHIVYRTSQDKKAELNDELTKEIKTTIGKEIADESGFSVKALKALREKNNMKFEDTELEKEFEKLILQYENQAKSSSNN